MVGPNVLYPDEDNDEQSPAYWNPRWIDFKVERERGPQPAGGLGSAVGAQAPRQTYTRNNTQSRERGKGYDCEGYEHMTFRRWDAIGEAKQRKRGRDIIYN